MTISPAPAIAPYMHRFEMKQYILALNPRLGTRVFVLTDLLLWIVETSRSPRMPSLFLCSFVFPGANEMNHGTRWRDIDERGGDEPNANEAWIKAASDQR